MSAPPPAASSADAAEKERVLALRRRHIGFNVSLHFARTPRGPLLIDRGEGAWLVEQGSGRRFLDCVNNVAHLGHSHAGFVRACAAQTQLLNTNSRYLHAGIADYSRRLCATFPKPAEGEGAGATAVGPGPLEVVFWVNSGSEANDLALRLARAHTGRRGIICVETAYHGHTGELIGISPYKHDRPGGAGRPAWVRAAACPDALSGRVRGAIDDDAVGAAYAADVDKQLASFAADARAEAACVAARDRRRTQAAAAAAAAAAGATASAVAEDAEAQAQAQAFLDAQLMPDGLSAGCAAFIMESILSCGGQVLPPAGYLRRVYASVRAAGAVCIADEVQVGFGRVGSHFWAFERQGADVRPDIVTLGKPMGNGFPVAAVVTTAAVARSFVTGMEYFNTYGGNPVAAAAATAVMDAIEAEGLQANAARVGAAVLAGFGALAADPRFSQPPVCIGSVRGCGLMCGLELIAGPRGAGEAHAPDGDGAIFVKNFCYEQRGVLISTDGLFDQVIKVKPPMCFSEENAAQMVAAVGDGLAALLEARRSGAVKLA